MRIPLIIVRDEDGREHVVGENPHDLLYVDENGALQYMNSHCSEGTKYGAYAFVGVTAKDDEYSVTGRPEIEFVTLNGLIDMESERLKHRLKAAVTGGPKMLNKTEGSNYVILERDEIVPIEVNKKRTDDTLEKLKTALKTIKGELQDVYDNDRILYHLLQNEVFSHCESSYRELYDGSIGWVEDVIYSISELKRSLVEENGRTC